MVLIIFNVTFQSWNCHVREIIENEMVMQWQKTLNNYQNTEHDCHPILL